MGGIAGVAVICLVALLFFRWYRRKPTTPRLENDSSNSGAGTGQRGMVERAGLLPLASAATGILGRGRQRTPDEPSGERGFQRISGRKLPSAFSDGLTALPGYDNNSTFENPRPVPMPTAFGGRADRHGRNNASNGRERSFYRDSTGYYGGPGDGSGSTGSSPGDYGGAELQPGPARQATLHPGGPYTPSTTNPFDTPPGSPRLPMLEGRSATPVNLGPGHHFVRSETPHSHNSRFTEEV